MLGRGSLPFFGGLSAGLGYGVASETVLLQAMPKGPIVDSQQPGRPFLDPTGFGEGA